MKVVVLQSNYLPWRGYFSLIKSADIFCFYDEVQYTKNDWRNRNKIYSKNGLFWITIPIDKNAVKKKISEVEISDSNWRNLHYKSIIQCYNKAPFFFQLEFLLDYFYIDNKWRNLSILNQDAIKHISGYLKLDTEIVNSKNYELIDGRVNKLLHLLKQLQCTKYISGPSGANYLSESIHLFEKENMELEYIEYPNSEYKQMSTPFQNYVSIIDLIANVEKCEIINFL